MSHLVRGPFDITWRGNTISQVEDVKIDYSQATGDYTTVQGQTYELDGPIKASVSLTLLASDAASLAVVLPQYHVNNGGVLTTGETIFEASGAIDVYALGCTSDPVYGPLDVVSCGNPGEVFRLVNARSKLDSIEFDDKIRKVVVKFVGEPLSGDAAVQFFEESSITAVS